LLPHFLDRAVAGDQLVLVGHVDPVEARRDDGRRGDAQVDLERALLEEHRDDLASRRAANDRVVHDHDAFPRHLGERVELRLDPVLAERLVGLDERAPDVPVLDQALGEGDPACAREADRRRRAGVRDGHDQVGLGRRLDGELLAHPHAGSVELDAAKLRVGPGEVDELEDAEGARAVRRDGLARLIPVLVHDDHLPRGQLPLHLGAEQVEGAGLGGEEPVVLEPPEDERADPLRVAEADELPLGEEDGGERALDLAHRAGNGLLERPLVAGDQRRDHLGVGGRAQARALGEEPGPELARVREVAVVAESHGARPALLDDRLCVRPVCGSGGGVARVADRDLAGEPAELLLAEDLRDEAHVAKSGDAALVGDRDPGRLLAAVLQGEEPEVREARDVAVGCVDAEDPAHQA
jgi:hypothetical protein